MCNIKIEWLCYSVFFLGYFLYEWSDLLSFRKRAKLRRKLSSIDENDKGFDDFRQNIFVLLEATTSIENKNIVNYIIGIVLTLIGGIILFLYPKLGFLPALTVALFSSLMPYVYLRIKLHFIRVNSSKEGDIIIGEILNNYKISYCNMKEALEITAKDVENAPYSRRLILDLVKGLNKVGSKEDVRELLNVFRYSLGTSWGNVLASNIYFAEVLGIKVTDSLTDLLEVVSSSREVLEHTKRENNESNLIFKYMAPVCFILTVLAACKFFGFTLDKYIKYQFGTATGLMWMLIIVGIYIAGIVINIFLTKTKMDV